MEKRTAALKKRIISLLTAAVMAASVVPVQALTSLPAHAESQEDAARIGMLRSGEPRHGRGWSWDGRDTLTLFGAELSSNNPDEPVIEPTGDINIYLINYNKIELSDGGVLINDESVSMTIDGSGILDIDSSLPTYGISVSNFYVNGGFIRTNLIDISVINNAIVNGDYFEGEATTIICSQGNEYGFFRQSGGYLKLSAVNIKRSGLIRFYGGYAEFALIGSIEMLLMDYGIFKCTNNGNLPVGTDVFMWKGIIAMFPNYSSGEIAGWIQDNRIIVKDTAHNGAVAAGSFYDENSSGDQSSTEYSIYNEGKTLYLKGTFGGSVYSYVDGDDTAILSDGATIGENATFFGESDGEGVVANGVSFGDNT